MPTQQFLQLVFSYFPDGDLCIPGFVTAPQRVVPAFLGTGLSLAWECRNFSALHTFSNKLWTFLLRLSFFRYFSSAKAYLLEFYSIFIVTHQVLKLVLKLLCDFCLLVGPRLKYIPCNPTKQTEGWIREKSQGFSEGLLRACQTVLFVRRSRSLEWKHLPRHSHVHLLTWASNTH